VQIFTPCTVGNGWMKILDWDKFAICLYDKRKRTGYRIWLDLEKAQKFPDLANWYLQRVSKKELPLQQLLDSILSAQRSALSARAVEVTRFHGPQRKKQVGRCPACGEGYPLAQGARCLACQGEGYYVPFSAPAAG
jgi:formylmethanofuran dehydrogenase subunit E